MEKTTKQFCPISESFQSTPSKWWQVTSGGDICWVKTDKEEWVLVLQFLSNKNMAHGQHKPR